MIAISQANSPSALPSVFNMSHEKAHSHTNEKHEVESDNTSEIDLLAFHEEHAGRLIIDPEYVAYLLLAEIFAESLWIY
jgi:hypothetical protein